jgi:hypothetical protein
MTMTTWWDDVEYLAAQSQRIEDMDGDNEEWECGVSEDHDWKPGDYECRRCHADLSDWNEEEEK